jgi:hypothetical protein
MSEGTVGFILVVFGTMMSAIGAALLAGFVGRCAP